MANDFDLSVNPLSGSQLEVLADAANALDGTEKALVSQGGKVVETTTQDIANLGGADYKVYTFLFSQPGTSAPSPTVLQNTLGGAVAWTRSDAGRYIATLNGAFTNGKTFCFGAVLGGNIGVYSLSDSNSIVGYLTFIINDANSFLIQTFNSSFIFTDFSSLLNDTDQFCLEVRVYS